MHSIGQNGFVPNIEININKYESNSLIIGQMIQQFTEEEFYKTNKGWTDAQPLQESEKYKLKWQDIIFSVIILAKFWDNIKISRYSEYRKQEEFTQLVVVYICSTIWEKIDNI